MQNVQTFPPAKLPQMTQTNVNIRMNSSTRIMECGIVPIVILLGRAMRILIPVQGNGVSSSL